MRWMLDTDTCIAIIKQTPLALKKLRGKSIGQVGISSITLG
jgi:predicted nucleic acid-binding protein